MVTAIGTAARGLGGTAPLYLGTLLAGAAIALSQVVTPAWIRARGSDHVGFLTGVVLDHAGGGRDRRHVHRDPVRARVRRLGGGAGDLGA